MAVMEDVEAPVEVVFWNQWQWLIELMKLRGLEIGDLAAKLGVGQWRIKGWISNPRWNLHQIHIEPLARVLGVSVGEIEAEVAKVRQ